MAQAQGKTSQEYLPEDEYRPEPPAAPRPPAWMDGSPRVGIHTSIAGDIVSALERAHALGANALQIFSASPRMWSRGPSGSKITDEATKRFRERRDQLRLGPLVIHDNYLINLASPDRVLRARSIQAFHDELARGVALGADFLVAHPGCATNGTRDAAIAAIADGLKQAAKGIAFQNLRVLLENTAGQGSSIGARFSELKTILNFCPELPLGVCVDTAHLFAAGHDLRKEEGLESALREIAATAGIANVFVLHINDSKSGLGSRLDRHEHIGKGKIGLEAFRRIVNHPQLAGRAFILETPIDRPGDDRRNVAALWKLLGLKAKQRRGAEDGFPPRTRKIRAAHRERLAASLASRRSADSSSFRKRGGTPRNDNSMRISRRKSKKG